MYVNPSTCISMAIWLACFIVENLNDHFKNGKVFCSLFGSPWANAENKKSA